MKIFFISVISILAFPLFQDSKQEVPMPAMQKNNRLINTKGEKLADRVLLPDNFKRVVYAQNSFATYLRELPLKPDKSKVLFYNGQGKHNDVHEAVINMEIGDKNLQQCADAIMRLRAEYFYAQKEYYNIHFNLTNGFMVDYMKWMEGYRVKVQGNKTEWIKSGPASNTYKDFRQYLDFVFMYAGTLSLSKEMLPAAINDLAAGNVFIQAGSPGHAVIIVDVAENKASGEKIFLLAQSYMPAQEIHVLKNPCNTAISPWYNANFNSKLITPEWFFYKEDLKKFAE